MFDIIDYIVFFSTILISFCIGIFFAVRDRKKNTTEDYFLAGRKSKTLPVALSFVVSFQSSLVMLGFPAEGYVYGAGLTYYVIGVAIAYIFAALVVVPVFYPLKLISVNEYFNLRYGNNLLRYISLASGIVYTIFYMATVTVGTSVALNVVMGIPAWGTILIYTVVTALYTSLGGMKAVIWTDVFQLIIMTTGMIAILVKASIDTGGANNVLQFAKDRFDASDFRFDPTIRYQFWNVSIGTITPFIYITVTQPSMQRIYSVPNSKAARNVIFIGTPIYVLVTVMGVFVGITLFAYYFGKGCDILEAGIVENINAIVPFSVLQLFHNQPGLAGLFTASLSSAAFSTLSSCLSSLSAVTYEDVIKVQFKQMSSYRATILSKIMVLVYGVLAMGLSFAILHIPGSISVIFISFMGCMDGPVCAAFLMSMMCRKATSKGVSIGIVCGSAIAFWLNIGNHFSDIPRYPYLPPGPVDQCYKFGDIGNISSYESSTISPSTETVIPVSLSTADSTARTLSPLNTLYSISYILYSLIGFLISVLVGLAFSFFTKQSEQVDERCLFSFRKHVLQELSVDKATKTDNRKNINIARENNSEEKTEFLSRETEL